MSVLFLSNHKSCTTPNLFTKDTLYGSYLEQSIHLTYNVFVVPSERVITIVLASAGTSTSSVISLLTSTIYVLSAVIAVPSAVYSVVSAVSVTVVSLPRVSSLIITPNSSKYLTFVAPSAPVNSGK